MRKWEQKELRMKRKEKITERMHPAKSAIRVYISFVGFVNYCNLICVGLTLFMNF